jgi:hypothetical protein
MKLKTFLLAAGVSVAMASPAFAANFSIGGAFGFSSLGVVSTATVGARVTAENLATLAPMLKLGARGSIDLFTSGGGLAVGVGPQLRYALPASNLEVYGGLGLKGYLGGGTSLFGIETYFGGEYGFSPSLSGFAELGYDTFSSGLLSVSVFGVKVGASFKL